ncbi:hypothetical protein MKW92_032729 [Papaver armeniacum]|nr:hypothetical protein MKW92_032729 [Papaver armeniacum]
MGDTAFDFEKESDVFEYVVKEGHGVKGLADTGLTTVPPRYIHPPSERIDPLIEEGVMLIMRRRRVKSVRSYVKLLRTRVFQVVNHGVSHEVMENAKRAAHIFFNLPRERKLALSKQNSSFLSSGREILEWKDYLSMVYVNDDEEVESFGPRNAANFYPPCPNPDLTVGVGRHSDLKAALTILLQDDIGEFSFVRAQDKRRIEIPPVEDALVINVGDTLEILSNGRYKKQGFRAPIFGSPIPPTTIGPLPGLAEKDGKTVSKQLLFGIHGQLFQKWSEGKATLDFARA